MTLIKGSEPWAMTADTAAKRRGHAARSELSLREALEVFCREKWPTARICHEMVMGGGKVRADVVAIDTAHIAAFEVKGAHDDTTRLLHQVGMFQLCVPEVWMIVAENHETDSALIRHLLPSVGLIVADGMDKGWGRPVEADISLRVEADAVPRPVVPKLMMEMLWAGELRWVCGHTGTKAAARATRPQMIKALLDGHDTDVLQQACCDALRGRDALWRADAPTGQAAAGVKGLPI